MSIATNKLMTLGDGKVLYDDLRGRVDNIVAGDTSASESATAAAASATAAATSATAAEVAKNYAQVFTGAPRTASVVGDMTDHDLIYVYTGTTGNGLTNGNWYYWNGTAWTSGGVYNSTALQTDTTLSVSGAAADAAACGSLKSAYDNVDNALDRDNWTVFLRKTINASNEITDSTNRMITIIFHPRAGQTFTIKTGYEFRWAAINSSSSVSFGTQWETTHSFSSYEAALSDAGLGMRLQIRNASNTSATIIPDEITYETDIPSLLIYKHTVSEEYADEKVKLNNQLEYIRRIGIAPHTIAINAKNGASKDDTTHTLTIPSGSTGENSFFTFDYSRKEIIGCQYSAQEVVSLIALKCNADITTLKPLIWDNTATTANSSSRLVDILDGDIYLYELRYHFPASISSTGNENTYVQFKNTTALSTTVMVQFVGSCIEWDGYDQRFVDNIRNSIGENLTFTIDKTSIIVDGQNDSNLFRGIVYCYNNNIRNIVVKPGTYDLITEMQEVYGDDWETDITGDTLLTQGIPLSNMNIVFQPGAFVECNYTGDNATFIELFSPFDLSSGTDVTVTGLHLECGNVRYGIHDDVSRKTTPCVHTFRECYVRKNDNNNVWEQPYCLAGGLGTHSKHILIDCDFACDRQGGGSYNVLYYHNNAARTGSDGYIRVENMYCSGRFGSVFAGGQPQNVGNATAPMYVHGCRFTKAPTQADNPGIILKAWGNTIESDN